MRKQTTLPADARRPADQSAAVEEELAIKARLLGRGDGKLSTAAAMASMLIAERHSKAARMKWLASAGEHIHGHKWRWQSTVSFWIAAAFIIGSLLFVLGGLASALRHLTGMMNDWRGTALVEYGYLAGGTYFTIGAYLGFFNVINAGNARVAFWEPPPDDDFWDAAYWGSLTYLVGALCFQVAVIVVVWFAPTGPEWVKVYLEYGAQAAGGLCFTLAALVEFSHNRSASWRDHVWWLCVWYLLGSVLFLVAAALAFGAVLMDDGSTLPADLHRRALVAGPAWDTGIAQVGTLPFSVWAVDVPYTVGSFAFWLGSWVQWRMWRNDQFGLGMLSEVNAAFGAKRASPQGERTEAVSMMAKTVYATLAVLNIGLAVAFDGSAHGRHELVDDGLRHGLLVAFDQLTHIAADVVASHSLLLLATVLHATPTIEPFNYLTWLLRVVEALWCLAEILTFLSLMAGDGM